MMTCPHSERLVPLLYDGELDGPLRREVRSHVSSCIVCTRSLTSIERAQELLFQEIDSQVEGVDFSSFWEKVEEQLQRPALPWSIRLQLWHKQWWPGWSLAVPVGAAAVAVLLTTLLLLPQTRLLKRDVLPPPEPEHLSLAANNQAQIESLSAAATVSLWNEPASNATVIWVGDDYDGAMP